MLPDTFIQQMQQQLGAEESGRLLKALSEPASLSLRLHPGKKSALGIGASLSTEQRVPWHPDGYYLAERPVFTLDPSFHAGAYYVQEASSMLLYEALNQVYGAERPRRVLDLCAAPGGKSTLLASWLDKKGLLVANETIRSRVGALRENLEKWGYNNIAVVSAEAEDFAPLEDWFDVVVADAPCSGEGLFRKDPEAVREWSPEQVSVCSARQKRILQSAVECLAPGGWLIYSTCTFNREENAANVAWMERELPLELVPLKAPEIWGMAAEGGGLQCYPHRVRGEGFFMALLRKKSGPARRHSAPSGFKSIQPLPAAGRAVVERYWSPARDSRFFQTDSGLVLALNADLQEDYLLLDKYLKIKWFGTAIGEIKGKDLAPDHALALALGCEPELPGVELDLEKALRFLKKETFDLPPGAGQGWMTARYGGLPLGWLKALPNRFNNYLPLERRIRMDIPVK